MNLTTKRIGALAAGAALLLLIVWYLALFRPESHHLSAAHKAHAAAEQQASQLSSQVAQLKVLEKQIPSDTLKLQQRKAAVPDNPDLAGALNQLQAAAAASGVQLSSLSPSTPATAGASSGGQQQSGPPSINLTIAATGTYPQLVSFMTRMDSMARTLVVNSTTISGGSTPTLSANFSAQIFYAGAPTP